MQQWRGPSLAPAGLAAGVSAVARFRGSGYGPAADLRVQAEVLQRVVWEYPVPVGLVLRCTNCNAASVSALFYLGPDAHVCRSCGAPFELADPAHDRRTGRERRSGYEDDDFAKSDWRSGFDRRMATADSGH